MKRQPILFFNFILLIIISFSLPAEFSFAQEIPQYKLNEVIVTASRAPVTFADLTRSVTVINQDQIKEAPVNSVQGLLKYALGVDLQQRGADGVQGDVGIRGGTFEETLIMIDGIKVNDPQTGHHNLNLPVSLDDVERIEVLKGQGSSIYGPDAFSGVINIITKKGNNKTASLRAEGGGNAYYKGELYGSYGAGILSGRVSYSKQKSDGYRHNTAFDINNFTLGSSVKTGAGNVSAFFGYNDKKFGANGFYSVLFPNQWEHTTTKFLNVTADLGIGNFSLSPKIYWRRNDDNYLLDYERPSFYQNIHQTNIYGGEIQSSLTTGIGTTSLGAEYTRDKIKSTNLGDHSRENKGIFAEQKLTMLKNWTVIAGAFAYNYATIGWKFWPSLDVGYTAAKGVRLYGSVGKAFRIPTYTELYYSSPASLGNPDLKHEETLNFEAGINYTGSSFYSRLSLFRKEGKNLIDWVRMSSNQPWTARNITNISTNGVELNLDFYPAGLPINKISIDYTYLNSNKETSNFESQYLLAYLRNQLIVTVDNDWWLGIKQNWSLRYEDRVNFSDDFIVDAQLSRKFAEVTAFIKITNLLDRSYQEVSGVPMPGRWLFAGAKLKLGE